MNTNIEKSIKLEEKDLFSFYIAHTFRKKYKYIGATILFVVVLIATLAFKEDTLINNILQIASVIGLVTIIILPITLKFRARKDYNSNKLLNRTQNYTFANEGITIETETGKSIIKWSDLYNVKDTKRCLYLYIGSSQAIILPKHYFNDNEIASIKKMSEHI
ncbi:YcxB family protein [Proteiniborus sp.]|uniref:YcxB family protein n=1 Tax=Proteiniborus sp. TaxID=2079015 RepID=UPI00332845CE